MVCRENKNENILCLNPKTVLPYWWPIIWCTHSCSIDYCTCAPFPGEVIISPGTNPTFMWVLFQALDPSALVWRSFFFLNKIIFTDTLFRTKYKFAVMSLEGKINPVFLLHLQFNHQTVFLNDHLVMISLFSFNELWENWSFFYIVISILK